MSTDVEVTAGGARGGGKTATLYAQVHGETIEEATARIMGWVSGYKATMATCKAEGNVTLNTLSHMRSVPVNRGQLKRKLIEKYRAYKRVYDVIELVLPRYLTCYRKLKVLDVSTSHSSEDTTIIGLLDETP